MALDRVGLEFGRKYRIISGVSRSATKIYSETIGVDRSPAGTLVMGGIPGPLRKDDWQLRAEVAESALRRIQARVQRALAVREQAETVVAQLITERAQFRRERNHCQRELLKLQRVYRKLAGEKDRRRK